MKQKPTQLIHPSALYATVVACLRSHIVLEADDGKRYDANYPHDVFCVCGDRVQCQHAQSSVRIVAREARTNLLIRERRNHTKQNVAANITAIIIVSDLSGKINTELIDNYLIVCAALKVKAILLFNKSDIYVGSQKTDRIISAYQQLAKHRVLKGSAKSGQGIAVLEQALLGEVAVMVGLSGTGKTTLANRLVPDLNARVADDSTANQTGKHTTTAIIRYRILDNRAALIDSPGVRSYTYSELSLHALQEAYPEFNPYLPRCSFANCQHNKEPKCAVRQAVAAGHIVDFRYENYRKNLLRL